MLRKRTTRNRENLIHTCRTRNELAPLPHYLVIQKTVCIPPARENQAVQKLFKMTQAQQLHRLYCGSFAITLISKSKPDNQVTPIAVTVACLAADLAALWML